MEGRSWFTIGWSRVELIVIDELGYVPLAEVAAELLFQVIAERAEKAAIICCGRNVR
jgi:DNA replication protein DnaC